MLRIAVPNKGSLAESSIAILKEAGYRQRSDSRDLVLTDSANGVEFYYLRPRDIAIYVGSGELEAGITGRDLLIDSGASAEEVLSLDFGGSTFRFAGPAGSGLSLRWINPSSTSEPAVSANALSSAKEFSASLIVPSVQTPTSTTRSSCSWRYSASEIS